MKKIKVKTREQAIDLVLENPSLIKDIPPEFIDSQLFEYVVCSPYSKDALSLLSSKLRQYELCYTASYMDKEALRYIPDNLKNIELCLTALFTFPELLDKLSNPEYFLPELQERILVEYKLGR